MNHRPKTPLPCGPCCFAAFKIVLTYLIIGSLWILFSDRLLLLFEGQPRIMLLFSTIKGWFFILVTALLLYGLTLREFSRRAALQETLKKENEQKAALLSEIHHRVRNNLQIVSSMLNLEKGNAVTPEGRKICNASIARVRSMGLVHEKLYEEQNFVSIDLSAYLRDLVAVIFEIYEESPQGHRCTFDLEPVIAGPDFAVPFGILVSEAVTNALRHGQTADGTVMVTIALHTLQDGHIELLVQDQGPGFSKNEKKSGLGLSLMTVLADQLGGNLSFSSQSGTRVSLRFKVRSDRPLPVLQ